MTERNHRRTLSILVVDDDAEMCAFLKHLLTKDGHDVTIAPDALMAIRLVRENVYHLILLDIVLPAIDGLDFLAYLRHTGSRTPVIPVTANPSIETILTAITMGVSGYLIKPFTVGEIRNAVRSVAEEAGSRP